VIWKTPSAGAVADKKEEPKPVRTEPADGGGGDKKSPFTDPAMKKHYSNDPNETRPRT
jgi:hypothetical protein